MNKVLKRRVFSYSGNPADLIRVAEKLSGFIALSATLSIGTSTKRKPPSLWIHFGTEKDGTQIHGYVALRIDEEPLIREYLTARGGKLVGFVKCFFEDDDDGGGGEELPVPTVGAVFDNLPTETAVRH